MKPRGASILCSIVFAAGCGARTTSTTPNHAAAGSPTTPGPCSGWVDVDALCDCLRPHSLAIDMWADMGDVDDNGDPIAPLEDADPGPAQCVPSRDPIGFWLEGADELQTLWLVQREGARARAVTAPLIGQVQGKRHVSTVAPGRITPRMEGALRFVEASYTFDDYEEEMAGIAESTIVDHIVRCQLTSGGAELACPVRFVRRWRWSVTDERGEVDPHEIEAFRKEYGGYPSVARKASVHDELRPSGEVVLRVDGPLPTRHQPASPQWLRASP